MTGALTGRGRTEHSAKTVGNRDEDPVDNRGGDRSDDQSRSELPAAPADTLVSDSEPPQL